VVGRYPGQRHKVYSDSLEVMIPKISIACIDASALFFSVSHPHTCHVNGSPAPTLSSTTLALQGLSPGGATLLAAVPRTNPDGSRVYTPVRRYDM
jgi:hypothetical protein